MYIKKKGITIFELIIAMLLTSVIMISAINFIKIIGLTLKEGNKEFDIQSSVRNAAEVVNLNLTNSTAVFLIPPDNFVETNLSDEWNYIGVLKDGKEIVHFQYVGGVHKKTVLAKAIGDVTYKIGFIKNNPYYVDKEVEVVIQGYSNGVIRETIHLDIPALNSLQVVDWAASDEASAIAYRGDERNTKKVRGVVSMILDVSGSMEWDMAGEEESDKKKHRTYLLREAGLEFVTMLSENDNIVINIVPFQSAVVKANITPFYKAKEDFSVLANIFNPNNYTNPPVGYNDIIFPYGGTNTGDGLKISYFELKKYNEANPTVDQKNYTVLMLDGVTNDVSFYKGTENIYKEYGFTYVKYYANEASYCAAEDDYENPKWEDYEEFAAKLHVTDNFSMPYVVLVSVAAEANKTRLERLFNIVGKNDRSFYVSNSSLLTEAFKTIGDAILEDLWFVNGPGL